MRFSFSHLPTYLCLPSPWPRHGSSVLFLGFHTNPAVKQIMSLSGREITRLEVDGERRSRRAKKRDQTEREKKEGKGSKFESAKVDNVQFRFRGSRSTNKFGKFRAPQFMIE
jgi:hypothetical protein